MKSKVYIHNDNLACIVLSKDHHNGIVVQLAVYAESLRPNHDGELIAFTTTKVIYESIIPVSTPEFRKAVADTIKTAQFKLTEVQNQHQILDGILNDYYSQNRDLNEPAKQ
jgi:hypothetical protein